MRKQAIIEIVGCHAEGEVGDVIVSGVEPPPGETIWEQRCFIERDEHLRNFVLNEPRLSPVPLLRALQSIRIFFLSPLKRFDTILMPRASAGVWLRQATASVAQNCGISVPFLPLCLCGQTLASLKLRRE